jgi:Ino eighty subunit 2
MAPFIILKFKKKANRIAYKNYVSRIASPTTVSPRSRARAAAVPKSSAAISKTSDGRGQSLKLTVKTAPSKLREVMRANEVESLQDTLGGGQVLEGSRRRRNVPAPRVSSRAADRPKYAEYAESDLEDDDEEEEQDEDQDMDDDAVSEDEDVDMEDSPMPPKAPKITLKPPARSATKSTAPKLLVTPSPVGNVKSVEDQEMEDDPGDEEVDESSDLSEDEEDGDQTNLLEEDAPGEEDEMGNEEDAPGEEEDLEDDSDDSDDDSSETPASGAATPDPAKLTKRQRKALGGEEFMALEMGPQQRKVRTMMVDLEPY